jgi:membrane associated rhomboid family serine protease
MTTFSKSPPVATIAIAALTGAVAAVAFLDPVVLGALRRDPAALASGQWWRLLTPLLVRTDGWLILGLMLAGTLATGVLVERLLGWPRLVLLYLAAGIAGQAAGYAWDPHGAGSSVAMLGLFAALWTLMLAAPDADRAAVRVAGVLGLSLAAALAGAALAPGSPAIPVVVGAAAGVLAINLVLRARSPLVERGIAVAALAAGVALTVLRDDHGPAILAGMTAAGLLLLAGLRGRRVAGHGEAVG